VYVTIVKTVTKVEITEDLRSKSSLIITEHTIRKVVAVALGQIEVAQTAAAGITRNLEQGKKEVFLGIITQVTHLCIVITLDRDLVMLMSLTSLHFVPMTTQAQFQIKVLRGGRNIKKKTDPNRFVFIY